LAVNGTKSGTKIERLPSDHGNLEIDDALLLIKEILAGVGLSISQVLGDETGRGEVQALNTDLASTLSNIRSHVGKGLTEIAKRHLTMIGIEDADVEVELLPNSDLARRRKLDLAEQQFRLAQAAKGLGIISLQNIYRDILEFDAEAIDANKAQLEAESADAVYRSLGGSPEEDKEAQGDSNQAQEANRSLPDNVQRANSAAGEHTNSQVSVSPSQRRGESKHLPQER
jgi:hypothetical protein